MRPHSDIIRRMAQVEASGIHLIQEWRVLEALARICGRGTVSDVEKLSHLTLISVSAVVLSLAGYTLRRFDPHPFLHIHGLDLQCLKHFTLPQDCEVELTAKGWQVVQLIGYGRPALLVPEGNIYAPVVADEADPEGHLARVALAHQLAHWNLDPAVAYHDA